MASFIKVAQKAEIQPGKCKTLDVAGTPVALFNVDGSYFAIHNTCLHRQGPLGEGQLSGNVVTCPLHGWQYDVKTGQAVQNPSMVVAKFAVKVEGEDVFVSDQPG